MVGEHRRDLEHRLFQYLESSGRDLDLVSAIAEDAAPTESQHAALTTWKHERGEAFYSDVLFALTHEAFPPEEAHRHWEQIVVHKAELGRRLGRSVGIAVAALDYFTHVEPVLHTPTVISASTLEDLAEAALRDGATGLFGASAFRILLDQEIARARRFDENLSLLMLDLDDFKSVNDRFGHPTGDRVLTEVGRTLQTTLRASDVIARVGGEEFAALLPRTAPSQLDPLVERLREAIAAPRPGLPRITASIGIATLPEHASAADELVERADAALYAAKRSGKNRVALARR